MTEAVHGDSSVVFSTGVVLVIKNYNCKNILYNEMSHYNSRGCYNLDV